jgi:hypothetical protein
LVCIGTLFFTLFFTDTLLLFMFMYVIL